MESCPTCRSMLQYELPDRPSRLFCPTCPYVCHLERKVKRKRRKHLVKKEIEPIKDDKKMGCSETDATCPRCGFGRALFSRVQILSADEPASTWYECLCCESEWLEV